MSKSLVRASLDLVALDNDLIQGKISLYVFLFFF